MPTMCRSPVHSAANAANLCDHANPRPLDPKDRLRRWDLEFEISLEFGAWDLGFPGPCFDSSKPSRLPTHPSHQPSTDFRTDRVTACLLHNESASYCPWRQPKPLCGGGEGKPSANSATKSRAIEPKRS